MKDMKNNNNNNNKKFQKKKTNNKNEKSKISFQNPHKYKPGIKQQNDTSCSLNRTVKKHITSYDKEKMVWTKYFL